MRIAFFVLVGVNLLLFFQLMGWMPSLLEDAREPKRAAQQLGANLAKPVSLDAANNSTATLPPLPPPAVFCFDVGPITAAEAEALSQNLMKADPTLKLEATQMEDGATYLVATAKQLGAREAARREAFLRNQGIRETFIIQDGELKNAVSLGLFRSRELAENLVKSFVEKGVNDLQIIARPNPPKAGIRIVDVPAAQAEATRQLLVQLPVRACPGK
jgi:hypothetical protein